jgi:hypothetical protein
VRAHLLLPLSLVVLAGCSGGSSFSQPEASTFHDGTCRTIAPQVLSIGRDARKLGTSATPPVDVRDRLKQAQEALIAVQPTADAAVVAPLAKLVVSIGLVRLRADGNTYSPDLGTALSTAYDALVKSCTTP